MQANIKDLYQEDGCCVVITEKEIPTKVRISFFESGRRDSNPRPSAWKANALSTELLPQFNLQFSYLRFTTVLR